MTGRLDPAVEPDEKHGTTAGYSRHRRRDEKPCEECREAQRLYIKNRRAANPERTKAEGDHRIASQRALQKLAEAFPESYRELLDDERTQLGLPASKRGRTS